MRSIILYVFITSYIHIPLHSDKRGESTTYNRNTQNSTESTTMTLYRKYNDDIDFDPDNLLRF